MTFFRQRWLAMVGLLLGYIAIEWIEYGREQLLAGIEPLDPSVGLAFAALLLGGPSFLPVVVIGEIGAAMFRSGGQIPAMTALLPALSVGFSWGIAALVLRRFANLRLAGQHNLVLLIVAAAAASLGTAAGDAASFWLAPEQHDGAVTQVLTRAWIGDMIGAMVVTPLLLVMRPPLPLPSRAAAIEATIQGAVALTMLWLLFTLPAAAEWQLYDLLVLPSIWAAARFGVRGAVVINIVLQIGMVAAFVMVVKDADAVTAYQFRMLILTLSTLFLGVAVTERRSVEDTLRRRQDQLDRCARLSMAGEMAAALAHELNQPLSAALTYSRTAQRLLDSPGGDPTKLRAAMNGAATQAERAGMIIRTLREFIGRGELNRQPQSLPTLVRDSLALLELDYQRAGIRVEAVLDRTLPPVLVDAVQVQQVLLNLLRNAIEAMEPSSVPRRLVTVVARPIDPGTVTVEVADSGPGLDQDLVARLFQPFSTTKAAGMGLGLAICRTIIEAHGGRLWLAGNSPGGCSFRFTLPVVSGTKTGGQA
ncbi:ATP-binding protein [Magnetospirillum molischianum]|uniref:histidine kinase n=1 Tax=Magnetospirillum molischianum DSM 120 TaxID=1150626 RepID=H8FRN4_MAGML|nr:ATP-binding protein [Magnetospirillum molischianum]CCG41022.1 Putative two-component sensor histidine kinase, classical system [Magnetospirillum molischianum DSM 120]